MEKISMNEVIAFVKKAMEQNLEIETGRCNTINIRNKRSFCHIIVYDNNMVICTNKSGKSYNIKISEEDLLKWKLLKLECEKYQNDIAVYNFNNFFEEDKPATIDDLDNEEED